MKIRRNTPDLLIVEDRPWLMGILLTLFILIFCAVGLVMLFSGEMMGLLFLLAGGGLGFLAFWAFVRRVQLVLYRPGNWAEIRRASLFRRSRMRHDLPAIHEAIVQTSQSDGSTLSRVALRVETAGVQGEVPLSQAYSNIGDPPAVARAINAWLAAASGQETA